jgi:isoprenylcysteine carboxyl methyltransferase (ICMT) family protein YpbQ
MILNFLSPLFYVLFALRLLTIFISARNEKKLKAMGAVEFGEQNSRLLVISHFIYYACCFSEGFIKGAFYYDPTAFTGFLIYAFSILMLYYVIYAIRHVWTVKLIIAPSDYHQINTTWLFKTVKHPNYFLNIIPELIGLAVLFHAWLSLILGLPLYLIILFKRIRLEEKTMRQFFKHYE